MLVEKITSLILEGKIKKAKEEILNDSNTWRVGPQQLNFTQRRDLLQAIQELNKVRNVPTGFNDVKWK